MRNAPNALDLWRRFSTKPGGKWLFTRMVCFRAPYFSSIRPRFEELRAGYCEVSIRKRRSVLNHIGTVHAIAMCNMAELAGGTMTEVTVPSTHRWIPKGMTVQYLKTATSDLTAIATPASTPDWTSSGEYVVKVEVRDSSAETVFLASITMWVSPRKTQVGT